MITPLNLETAAEDWLASKGVALVPISREERDAARLRLLLKGDLPRRRALRFVALWSLAPVVSACRGAHVRDMADFIHAEGFALVDAYGERTLEPEEVLPCAVS